MQIIEKQLIRQIPCGLQKTRCNRWFENITNSIDLRKLRIHLYARLLKYNGEI